MEVVKKANILHRTLATALSDSELTVVSGGFISWQRDGGCTTRYYWTDDCGGFRADYGRDND